MASIGEEQEEIQINPIAVPLEAPVIPAAPAEAPERELEPV